MKTAIDFLQVLHDDNLLAQKRLLKRELRNFKAALPIQPARLPRDIRKLLQFIHAHLFDPDLKVLAARRQCGIKNNNVTTHFRQYLGRSLREYIEHQRMRAAMQLLAHCELEIFLIGLGVGYLHEESFSRAFRRYVGYPPSIYRQRILQKKC